VQILNLIRNIKEKESSEMSVTDIATA